MSPPLIFGIYHLREVHTWLLEFQWNYVKSHLVWFSVNTEWHTKRERFIGENNRNSFSCNSSLILACAYMYVVTFTVPGYINIDFALRNSMDKVFLFLNVGLRFHPHWFWERKKTKCHEILPQQYESHTKCYVLNRTYLKVKYNAHIEALSHILCG